MAELKTKPTGASVPDFLDSLADETQRNDAFTLSQMLADETGDPPVLWGTSIVGFGVRKISYASGAALDWPRVAFSPRAQRLTLYLSGGFEKLEPLLAMLGKHSHGKGCLHLRRLAAVDLEVLRQIVRLSLTAETG